MEHLSKFSAMSQELASIDQFYQADEDTLIRDWLSWSTPNAMTRSKISDLAKELASATRDTPLTGFTLEPLLSEYHLNTEEGIVLLCLAEALLRIPDAETASLLIHDALSRADWSKHLGHSQAWWVNASSWALMLTGRWLAWEDKQHQRPIELLKNLVEKLGEPILVSVLRRALKLLGQQFVIEQDITAAINASLPAKTAGYQHSYDMLGEAAITQQQVEAYFISYQQAIIKIGEQNKQRRLTDTLSVKLSALHPRYEALKQEKVLPELTERLTQLVYLAKEHQVAITIDAEESQRLTLSLAIFETVFNNPELKDWPHLGLAVQAYQKRSVAVIGWLALQSQRLNKIIPVRLVKGAYWDSEIKYAQQQGYQHYPVFTQKLNTDRAYLACATKLLQSPQCFYPQFATHNAYSIASILVQSEVCKNNQFEFQRLYGMGESIYANVLAPFPEQACRIYAPVGDYERLLPYLVRRLLENTSSTSFVRQIHDAAIKLEDIIQDPYSDAVARQIHPMPLPSQLYQPERSNSQGINLANTVELFALLKQLEPFINHQWKACPLTGASSVTQQSYYVFNPANTEQAIGELSLADAVLCKSAVAVAHEAFQSWYLSPVMHRAQCLDAMAKLLEQHRAELVALCMLEAGKTLVNALAEVREAVDFCYYYAQQARQQFLQSLTLPGPTGESNNLTWEGRGVFVCISPWNFPIAIFVGQIAAALAAGNTVIAKPAQLTALMAFRVVELFYTAGIPRNVLHYLPATGQVIEQSVLTDARIAGVAFTGSTATAYRINQTLAQRQSVIAPFIAETAGQNAMIVDSSALAEQLVQDIIASAFDSAGQRCSALRIVFMQEDMLAKVLPLLTEAVAELRVGSPLNWLTDIGPVINQSAKNTLQQHITAMQQQAKCLAMAPLAAETAAGYFIAPHIFQLDNLQPLQQEVFGPILHIIPYSRHALDKVIDSINALGFGLTLGIHTRIQSRAADIARRVRVGNVYVNRNMIGATVGVQPFGGRGLSGTGPKAGGPFYLHRFATEKVITHNTAAVGGNIQLLTV